MRYFFVVLPPPLFTMAQAHWPNRAAVPREVLKWLQSLDLSFSPRNIRRDFSNGYLVAEVFSCYYPNDFQNHFYDNGPSLPTKTSNWSQIEKSLQKLGIRLPRDVIEGTIHCKPRAAEILIQEIYVLLTNRRIQSFQDAEADFTDRSYQEMLPMVARATASRAIKSNLRLSEVIAEPSIEKNRQKVTAIIHMHLQQRRAEKVENPERFNIKPTLGELAVRLPLPSDKAEGALSDSSQQIQQFSSAGYEPSPKIPKYRLEPGSERKT